MTLNQLKVLLVAARKGSFTATATELHVTQASAEALEPAYAGRDHRPHMAS